MGEKVIICEVGPRDGLQIAKSRMATATKARWIKAIAEAGVPAIEVGSFVPPRLIPQMADTAEIVAQALTIPGLLVAALAPNLYRHQRRTQGFTAERIMRGLRRLYVDGLRTSVSASPAQGG